jgi:hypothetical protein
MMSSRPRGSKQGIQKDHRSDADTASTKGMSNSSGRSASLGGVESQTEWANERETEDTIAVSLALSYGERERECK